ncbi:MAG: hypothetical protein L0H70_05600, partial [Xanthomonadales bacterium]|nr:hypothetical protein [Xanthomonadales bacterium]
MIARAGTANRSILVGSFNTASGVGAMAGGDLSGATGNYAIAWGQSASATGHSAVAFGHSAQAHADNAATLGSYARANYAGSTAVGYQVYTTKENQVMLGRSGVVTTFADLAELGVFATAGLPATAVSGSICYASDARKPSEAAAGGTGMPVFYDAAAAAWFTFDGNQVTS